MAETRTVGIIGAGTMGHGIAQCFGVKGWKVNICDANADILAAVPQKVKANLDSFVALGLVEPGRAESCLQNITTCQSLAEAVEGADLVIEAVNENLDLKRKIFAQVEDAAPKEAILATNTSAIAIGLIAEEMENPERLVGTHFWNPPHVIPCVEIVKSRFTREDIFQSTAEIIAEIDKEPVRVLKDIPGFLGNRMQHALQREAMSLVDNGVAEPEDVDRVVKYGFGLRLALMGPLERADLGGLDVTMRVQEYLLQYLDARTDASPKLKSLVDAGDLGAKTGQGYYDWPDDKKEKVIQQRDTKLLKLISLAKG